jgi:2C-methyl-D-erythritol 2,4-cyclodiphosphate synthase
MISRMISVNQRRNELIQGKNMTIGDIAMSMLIQRNKLKKKQEENEKALFKKIEMEPGSLIKLNIDSVGEDTEIEEAIN